MRVLPLWATLVFALLVQTADFADTTVQDKGSIRLGLLSPASGRYARIGSNVNAGFQYFLATHGDLLGGFRVELRTGDEGDSVAAALAIAHQLVDEDDVDAIVGVANSDDAYGIADYLDSQKKPLIVTSAGADELTQAQARKTLFRVGSTSSQDTMPLGDYACRHLRLRTAAIVGADYSYGWEAAGGFARAYTDAGCRVVQEQYGSPGSDWSALLTKVDRSAALIFGAIDEPDGSHFLAAYREAHVGLPLLTTSGLADEPFVGDDGPNALGVISASDYAAALTSPENVAFRRGFEALGGQAVSEYVEDGYVAAEALSLALERLPAGPIKSGALLANLSGVQFDAPRGPVRFDEDQQVVNDVFIRRVVQVGGRYRDAIVATCPFVSQFWHYDSRKYLAFPDYAKLKGTWVRP